MDLKAIVSETDLIFFSLLLRIPLFNLYFKKNFSKNPPLPPGPFAWPIVGNFFQMGRQLHSILANLTKVHGPLMSLRLGTQINIIASSPEAAREVLKTHDRELSGRQSIGITKSYKREEVDFMDFEGKGIGQELRELIVEGVELGMIPDLSIFLSCNKSFGYSRTYLLLALILVAW
ncbi:hypothetical protein CMV_012067 [Castanea mollissima]|uniref:Uncharacterized protein n=1 Tax=Castanea mollissima TaxID=60419 RepID=A0A8J4RBQ7_9ROSI|nr:hypothetical protein CMV_012067 [Castanea mollissima]